MNTAVEFFNHPLLLALGWALMHFVWQGAAIAGLLFLAQAILRTSPAIARYIGACIALLLMAASPFASFWYLQNHRPRAPIPANPRFTSVRETILAPPAGTSTPVFLPVQTKTYFRPQNLVGRLQSALPWFVACWLAVVSLLALRLLLGYMRVRRIQKQVHEVMDSYWQEKLSPLAERLCVSRPVRLCKSALVEVPTVIGWLRPIILFPASTVTGLPPAQLEAILAHELAHIRRHDYLVNLLQNLIETFLFYHPAVWWVSHHISQERELCCDDLTVKVCADRITYARALATLEELRGAAPDLALAASGGSLVRRIRRLLGMPLESHRSGWWLAGTIALVVVSLLVMVIRRPLLAAGSDNLPKIQKAAPAPKPSALQFRLVAEESDTAPVDEMPDPNTSVENAPKLRILAEVLLDGTDVAAAELKDSAASDEWELAVTLTDSGAEKFGHLTEQNVSRRLAIVFDGKLLSAPRISEKVAGKELVFKGHFSKAEAMVAAPNAESHIQKSSPQSTPSKAAETNKDSSNRLESPPISEKRAGAALLIRDAKLLIEMGKLDQAEEKLKEAVRNDPNNHAAFYYLDQIKERRFRLNARVREPQFGRLREAQFKFATVEVEHSRFKSSDAILLKPNSPANPDVIHTSKSRQAMVQKLNTIVLEEVHYDGVPLSEVIKDLFGKIRERDPDHRGINFIMNSNIDPPPAAPQQGVIDPATGLQVAAAPAEEPVDLNAIQIRIDPAVTDVRLLDVLDIITKVASPPIKYSIEDYAIVFSLKEREVQTLYTRTFYVDANTFLQGLQRASTNILATSESIDARIDRAVQDRRNWALDPVKQLPNSLNLVPEPARSGGIAFLTRTNSTEGVSDQIRQLFLTAGVDFSAPKSVFYNDRGGTLFVRATLQELDIIESVIQMLNAAPPQVKLDVKCVEIPASDAKQLKDWFFSDTLNGTDSPELKNPAKAATNSSLASVTGILTASQLEVVINALEQQLGFPVRSSQSVTTLSGRQTQIKAMHDSSGVEIGPVLEVVPYVAADGYTIQMTIIKTLKEFLGQNLWAVGADRENTLPPSALTTPHPRFRLRQVVTSTTVMDGQTAVVIIQTSPEAAANNAPILEDLPWVGRFFRSEPGSTTNKNVILFVTPTIVDPAGNPVHSAE